MADMRTHEPNYAHHVASREQLATLIERQALHHRQLVGAWRGQRQGEQWLNDTKAVVTGPRTSFARINDGIRTRARPSFAPLPLPRGRPKTRA